MEWDNHQIKQLIEDIRRGEARREKALKAVFQNQELREVVKEVVLDGGGKTLPAMYIFMDCIVLFDRLVRLSPLTRLENIELKSVFSFLSKRKWGNKLEIDSIARSEALDFVAEDQSLLGQVEAKIVSQGGTQEGAQEAYQSGMLKLEESLRLGNYRGGAIKGYFVQICYNLWRNSNRRMRLPYWDKENTPEPTEYETPLKILEKKELNERLLQLFKRLDKGCQQIILLKYYVVPPLDMKGIADRMGLKSAQAASNKLSKCRRNWRSLYNKA